MPTISIRTYLEIAAVLVIIAGFIAYTIHERSVGRQQIELADQRATQKAQDAANKQTAALVAVAQKAAQEASNAQKKLDDYIANNPVKPVRLCYQNLSSQRVPETASNPSGPTGSGPKPTAVPPVSSGTAGPDLSGGLTELVQSAGRMATLYSQALSSLPH